MPRIILVTAAEDFCGNLIATKLASSDDVVYAGIGSTAGTGHNRILEMQQFSEATDLNLRPINLDLNSDHSVAQALQNIREKDGGVDVIVHRTAPTVALTGIPETDGFDTLEAELQQANRVHQLLLPVLKRQRHGFLLWIASRHPAIDQIADDYAAELAPWNVETSLVFPIQFAAGSGLVLEDEQPLAGDSSTDPTAMNMRDLELARAVSKIVELPFGRKPSRIDVALALQIKS